MLYFYTMTVSESTELWIMHRNFITAAKQLMGHAFSEINTSSTQCCVRASKSRPIQFNPVQI